MEIDIGDLSPFALCIFFTLTHAYFSLSETALLRSHSAVLRRPENKSRVGARFALSLIYRPSKAIVFLRAGLIASIIGFVFCVLYSSIVEDIANLFGLESLDDWHSWAIALALIATQILLGIVSSICSFSDPEKALMKVAPSVFWLVKLFSPVLQFLILAASPFLRLFRVTLPKTLEFSHSAEDIGRIVEGDNNGVVLIDQDEKVMLRGVVEFGQTVAREVMTPRTDLVSIPFSASFDEVVELVIESGLSRFPVRGDSIDDIKGILLARDILEYINKEKAEKFVVANVMRQAYFIPDVKPIDDLLNEFKRRKLHMAIVLDEHGGVDGLVTLEDLLEEIVGDIFDESDTPEEDFEIESSGDLIVDGGMLVFEVNEHFNLRIPEGDYDTIAGFVFTSLGRMPNVGDKIEINSANSITVSPAASGITTLPGEFVDSGELSQILLIVEEIENNRISSIRIKQLESSEIDESKQSRAAS